MSTIFGIHLPGGQVVNLSKIALLVIETTTNEGKKDAVPAVVHILLPMYQTPHEVDVDGFKRADGGTIWNHSSWLKIRDTSWIEVYSSTEGVRVESYIGRIFRDGNRFVDKVDNKTFGDYVVDTSPWGMRLKIVADIVHDKKKKTIGYLLNDGTQLKKTEALAMAEKNEIYNVSIVTRSDSGSHLRRKRRYLDMGIG